MQIKYIIKFILFYFLRYLNLILIFMFKFNLPSFFNDLFFRPVFSWLKVSEFRQTITDTNTKNWHYFMFLYTLLTMYIPFWIAAYLFVFLYFGWYTDEVSIFLFWYFLLAPILMGIFILSTSKLRPIPMQEVRIFFYLYIFLFLLMLFRYTFYDLIFGGYVGTGVGYVHTLGINMNFSQTFNTVRFFGIGFTFTFDLLGGLFIILNVLLMSLCLYMIIPMSYVEPQIRLYLALLLFLMALLNMVFLAADILTFFLAFESVLIPMILLIGIWGSPNRRQANNYLIFYTSVGAIPMLLGILYLWNQVGSMGYLTFSQLHLIRFSWSEQMWLWVAFFISFAIKTPMVPFHIWLPKAHVDAPTTGSVILAGLLLKVGLFGFLRLLIPVFPLATDFFAPYIAAFATVGVLYASFVTLRQIDMKRIIAYSSVAHMNMALVSLCSVNSLGITASIYLMLSHGIIASALFFLVGFLYNRFHQRTVTYYGDIATLMPVFTIFFFYFSLANMAFPLTSGFIGEFFCLAGIMSTNTLLGILSACSMLLTTVYSMLLFGRVCLGNPQNWLIQLLKHTTPNTEIRENYPNRDVNLLNDYFQFTKTRVDYTKPLFSTYDLQRYEFDILVILASLTLIFGIYPEPIFQLVTDYVSGLTELNYLYM